jgi:hypothetical protein
MCLLLIFLWCLSVAGRCGEWINSRFHGFHSRLTRLREFPRKGVELPRGFWRRMAVARVDRRNSRLTGNGWQLRLGRQLQPITNAEFRQNMGRAGRVGFELLPQPADEDAQILDLVGLRRTPDFAQ